MSAFALLEGTPEVVGSQFYGVDVKATFTDFYGLDPARGADEVYVDVPMDSSELHPLSEEMESMGLTVHFHLPLLDRIEEACCDETSAARMSRSLGPQCRRQHCHDGHGGAGSP